MTDGVAIPLADMDEVPLAADGPAVYNPFDPAFRANPYPFYDRLRAESPAYVTPVGLTIITRYDDVSRTLRSNDFSRDVDANATPRDDPIFERRRDRRADGAKTILNLDPPDHTRLRRLVSKAFTPSAIDALRSGMEAQVDAVLDRAAERGEMELVDELAFPVPFQVISDLLDLPQDRTDEIRDWSQALTASLEPTATLETLDASDAAVAQLVPYLAEVVEARRANLGNDVLSALLVAEEAGDRLSIEELLSFVVLLYVAGHETTVNLIGNGTLALLRHPDELQRWKHDPTLDAVGGRRTAPVRRARPAHRPRGDDARDLRRGRAGGDGRARIVGAVRARRRQPRCGGVRRPPHAAPRPPQRQPPSGLRRRHPLLPRRIARPPRGVRGDRAPDPPVRLDRTARRTHVPRPPHHPRRRTDAPRRPLVTWGQTLRDMLTRALVDMSRSV